MARRIRISNERYRAVHGRNPRGVAMWLFKFGPDEFLEAQGTFTEAKKKVRAQAERLGFRSCGEVLP